jgi:hypothetical protein
LNGIGRCGEINDRVSAIKDLDEVVGELRTCIAAAGIQLADHQTGNIVIFDRADTLAVRDDGAARIGHIHKERFRGFDVQVAVYRYIECVRLLAGRNRLGR